MIHGPLDVVAPVCHDFLIRALKTGWKMTPGSNYGYLL